MTPFTPDGTAWAPQDLLPALIVALATAGLLRWLRRLGDPVPRATAGALAAVLLLALGAALLGGYVLLPLDGLSGEVPFQASRRDPGAAPGNPLHGDLLQLLAPADLAVRDALERGEWPLWNPWVGAGIPLLGDPQAQAFSPSMLLARLLPPLAAAATVAGLRMVVGFLFGFALLRRFGASESAATLGAVAWSLGGPIQMWLGWPLATAAALLPAALHAAAVLDAATSPAARAVAHAVGVGLALLLAGHPEGIALVAALAAADLARRVLARRAATATGGPGWRHLAGRAAFAATIALGLSAPVLLPTASALRHSERLAVLRGAPVAAAPGPRAWLPLLAPQVFGNERYASGQGRAYAGPRNVQEDAMGFVGSFLLLSAATGAFLARRSAGRAGPSAPADAAFPATFWRVATLAAAAGMALGAPRAALIVAFGVVLFGVRALDLDLGERPDAAGRASRRPWIVLGCAAATGLVLVAAYRGVSGGDDSAVATLRSGWLSFQAKILVLGAAWWLIAPALARARARAGYRPGPMVNPAAVLAGLLIAGELLVAHRPMNPPGVRARAIPSSATLDLARARSGEGRLGALGDHVLPPNLAALWGLEDARAYNPVTPAAYRAWTASLLARPGAPAPHWDARAGIAGDRRLDRLAVRFLLHRPRAAGRPDGGAAEGPGEAAAGTGSQVDVEVDVDLERLVGAGRLRPLLDGPEARLFERTTADAWFTLSPPPARGESARIERTPAHWSWIADTADRSGGGPPLLLRDPTDEDARLHASAERSIRAALLQDGGWVVLADRHRVPADVAGAAASAGPADSTPLVAARFEGPAPTRIDLVYRPPGFVAGATLAALALSVAIAAWPGRPTRPRGAGDTGEAR